MPWERQEEVVGAPWSIWTEPGETRRTWAVGDTEWERAKTASTGRREVCSASTAGSLRSKRLSVTLAGSTGLSSLHQVKELPQLLETQRLHLHSVRVKQHWMRNYGDRLLFPHIFLQKWVVNYNSTGKVCQFYYWTGGQPTTKNIRLQFIGKGLLPSQMIH